MMGAGSSLAAIKQLEFEEAGAEGLSLEYPTMDFAETIKKCKAIYAANK